MRAILIQDRYVRGNRLINMLKNIPDLEIMLKSDPASEAPALCAEHRPDLLILNTFSKRDHSALVQIRCIKREWPEIKVFVLTGEKDYDLVLEAKEAGADIVLWKNLTQEELKQLIRLSAKQYRVYPNPPPELAEPRPKK